MTSLEAFKTRTNKNVCVYAHTYCIDVQEIKGVLKTLESRSKEVISTCEHSCKTNDWLGPRGKGQKCVFAFEQKENIHL